MTYNELVTDLENAGALFVKVINANYNNRGAQLSLVSYRTQKEVDVVSESKSFEIVQTNYTDDFEFDSEASGYVEPEYNFHKEKPEILKTPPPAPRDFYYTDTQIVSGFGSVLNGLSAIKVLSKRRVDDEDEVTVRYEVTADDNLKVYDMTLMLWEDAGSPEFRVISDTGPGPTPV